jgi:hypothetical protein
MVKSFITTSLEQDTTEIPITLPDVPKTEPVPAEEGEVASHAPAASLTISSEPSKLPQPEQGTERVAIPA